MTDHSVSNVNRVEASNTSAAQVPVHVQVQQAQAQQAQANPVSSPAAKEPLVIKSAEEVEKESTSEKQKQAQVTSSALNSRQTNLKFQVDSETHEVTIMILDRATNKVILTIPANKIKDIPPGDLLQYQV